MTRRHQTPTTEVIFDVRKKLSAVPVLACLLAIPSALAASDDAAGPAGEGVPSLVAVSSLEPASSPDPTLSGGNAGSDNAPTLIASSVAGDPLDHQEAREQLQAAARGARRERDAAQGAAPEPSAAAPAVAVPPQLAAIAACESGGDPQAIGGGGAYRGKYQFSPATWQAVGGSGDPAAAPEAEQDRRAAMLYAQSGPSQWPVCGR